MIKRQYLIVIFVVAQAAIVHASIIILDQTHWIRVEDHGELIYEAFSSNPLSYTYNNDILSGRAYTSEPAANMPAYLTYADADALMGFESSEDFDFEIRTSISITFQSNNNGYELFPFIYNESYGCWSHVELNNLTLGERVYYQDFYGYEGSNTGFLNTDQIYNLYMCSGVYLTTADYSFSTSETHFEVFDDNADIIVIPEPGAILLAGLGAIIIGRWRGHL